MQNAVPLVMGQFREGTSLESRVYAAHPEMTRLAAPQPRGGGRPGEGAVHAKGESNAANEPLRN
jgi:hypothetical protein